MRPSVDSRGAERAVVYHGRCTTTYDEVIYIHLAKKIIKSMQARQGVHGTAAYSTAWECARVIGMIRLVKSLGTSWTARSAKLLIIVLSRVG